MKTPSFFFTVLAAVTTALFFPGTFGQMTVTVYQTVTQVVTMNPAVVKPTPDFTQIVATEHPMERPPETQPMTDIVYKTDIPIHESVSPVMSAMPVQSAMPTLQSLAPVASQLQPVISADQPISPLPLMSASPVQSLIPTLQSVATQLQSIMPAQTVQTVHTVKEMTEAVSQTLLTVIPLVSSATFSVPTYFSIPSAFTTPLTVLTRTTHSSESAQSGSRHTSSRMSTMTFGTKKPSMTSLISAEATTPTDSAGVARNINFLLGLGAVLVGMYVRI